MYFRVFLPLREYYERPVNIYEAPNSESDSRSHPELSTKDVPAGPALEEIPVVRGDRETDEHHLRGKDKFSKIIKVQFSKDFLSRIPSFPIRKL